MQKLLVTGANGFVGQHFCRYLTEHHIPFRAALRKGRQMSLTVEDVVYVDDIGQNTDWHQALDGVSHIVHLAALGDAPSVSADLHHAVNYEGTLRLAQQAHASGIERMVFLSTIKVNGEVTTGQPFKASDIPAPLTDYARSKNLAEKALLELSQKSAMEVSIIRPPVIYGPGSKGSIAQLVKAVRYHLPLPFAALENARSILNIFNLCSFMNTCVTHSAAKNSIALISDGEDVSTPGLVRHIGSALQRKPQLFTCSVGTLKFALHTLNRDGWYAKLCCDLQVDTSQHQQTYGWSPDTSIQKALAISFS